MDSIQTKNDYEAFFGNDQYPVEDINTTAEVVLDLQKEIDTIEKSIKVNKETSKSALD